MSYKDLYYHIVIVSVSIRVSVPFFFIIITAVIQYNKCIILQYTSTYESYIKIRYIRKRTKKKSKIQEKRKKIRFRPRRNK